MAGVRLLPDRSTLRSRGKRARRAAPASVMPLHADSVTSSRDSIVESSSGVLSVMVV